MVTRRVFSLGSLRALVALMLAFGAHVYAAPFIAAGERHFDHAHHDRAVADAKRPAPACALCHNLTSTGAPVLKGKAEHARCFDACHDHQYGVTCGALSTGGKSGPGKSVCLVCHATILSTCTPPGLVTQDPNATGFESTFGHTSKGHTSLDLERDCAVCHADKADAGKQHPSGHTACGECHAQGAHATGRTPANPSMMDCAGCHKPIAGPKPKHAPDVFALAFDHRAHTATAHADRCLTCHLKAVGDALKTTMMGCQAQCHDGVKSFSTTGTSCTRCHKGDDAPIATTRQAFSHASHTNNKVQIAQCTSCHALDTEGMVAAPAHGKDHLPCSNPTCHQAEFASRTPMICGVCHDASSPWSKQLSRPLARKHGEQPEWFQTINHAAHLKAWVTSGNAGPGGANANTACASCHGGKGGGAVPSGHGPCAACHNKGQLPAMTDCAACHARTAAARPPVSTWAVTATFKHETHVTDPRTKQPTTCVTCHVAVAGAKALAAVVAPTTVSYTHLTLPTNREV